MQPRILCLSFSDIRTDARVLRQIDILAEFGEVTSVGYGGKPVTSTEHLELNANLPSLPQTPLGVTLLALHAFKTVELSAPAVQEAMKLIGNRTFDLIVANEARALPLAHRVSKDAPVWGDMHEWAPEEREHVLSWRILVKPFMTHVCATYLPKTKAVSVVNDSIASLYEEQFGASTSTVRNSRPYVDLHPTDVRPPNIRLVHSGAAVPGRNLEGMIEAVGLLGPGYSLDFYLVPARDGGRYLRTLQSRATGPNKVTFHPPVPPEDLPRVLNSYDVGIFSLPPQTRNHALMLPNKFFDFVQARLAIVFSPSPETSRLIKEYDLGVVTKDYSPESLADALRSLSIDDITKFKSNAHASATALSSANDEEAQRKILRDLTGQLS